MFKRFNQLQRKISRCFQNLGVTQGSNIGPTPSKVEHLCVWTMLFKPELYRWGKYILCATLFTCGVRPLF